MQDLPREPRTEALLPSSGRLAEEALSGRSDGPLLLCGLPSGHAGRSCLPHLPLTCMRTVQWPVGGAGRNSRLPRILMTLEPEKRGVLALTNGSQLLEYLGETWEGGQGRS